IKARRLLPNPSEIDLDEELALIEERDRLLQRLLMCVTYRDVAAVLERRLRLTNRLVPRLSGIDQVIDRPPPEVAIPVDPPGLAAIAARVFSARPDEVDLDHLDLELPSV